jgi:hypothetical protein
MYCGPSTSHYRIVKFTLLASVTDPSTSHVTRIFAVVVVGPVTVQLKVLLVLPLLADRTCTIRTNLDGLTSHSSTTAR